MIRGTWIEKPFGDPTQTAPDGVGTPSLPRLDPAYQAKKDLERRLDAWSEAEGLVQWARRLENTAHEELNAALDDANALVASLMKGSTWLAAPMIPSWIAGGREGTGPIVFVMSALLFAGALGVGWWFIQREIRVRENDER